MALEVLTGTANAGKTGVVRARLLSALATGARAALLLPTGADVARATNEFAPHAPIGLEIRTLDAFLDRLWSRIGDGRLIVGDVQRRVLLEESVSRCTLQALGASARTPGFLRMLEQLVRRVAESDVQPLSESRAGEAAQELLEVSRVYGEVLAERGLVERAETQQMLARADLDGLLPALIAVNRITGLTRPQERFLVAAAGMADVLVALTYARTVPATQGAEDLARRLGSAGTTTEVVAEKPFSATEELTAIERGLCAPRVQPLRATGSVVLAESYGDEAEAASIVREVQRAILEGARPETIAVAFRSPRRHVRSLRAAFDESGIAADWDVAVPFAQTGLGRALSSLAAFFCEPGRRSSGLDFLRSPYSPAADDAVDLLDARLRRRRIMDIPAVVAEADMLGADAAAMVSEARVLCSAPLKPGSTAAWERLLASMMRSAHGGAPQLDAEGLLDCSAQATALQALAQAEALGSSWTGARVIATIADAEVVAGVVERAGHVQVTSVERLRGRRFEYVILGGLGGAEFPRPERDDALSSPSVRKSFADRGVDLTPRADVAAERLLFYQAATRAAKRLVLSYQVATADGVDLERSVFVEELLDLYRPAGSIAVTAGPPSMLLGLDALADDPHAPSSERRSLRGAAARGEDAADESGDSRLAHARHRARPRAACLGARARIALQERQRFSVSDIETYLQCRFRWYVERLLRPAELDAEVDAAAAGKIAHDVLARFYDRFSEEIGHPRVSPETLPAALGLHEEVSRRVLEEVVTLNLSEDARVVRAVRETRTIIEADATLLPGFAPTLREWSFGLEQGDEGEDFGDFTLVGRVDRIDTDGSSFVVTDYKTGSACPDWGVKNFERSGRVQLPLYAAVVQKRLGLDIGGALYRSTRGGKPRGFVKDTLAGRAFVSNDILSAAEVAAAVADARERALQAVADMRAGIVTAEPRTGTCPDYCGARVFCPARRSPDA